MDSFEHLPDAQITPRGKISQKFLALGISSFKEACKYVHEAPYGYNSEYEDTMIFFKEQKGTCTTKHAVIAGLAEELEIPLFKMVGVYKFTEKISEGAGEIMEKYNIPYIPMVHCFLVYKEFRFDLTEGNHNGKKESPEYFIHTAQVDPFISRKEEYRLFRRVLKEKILPSREMAAVKERTLLKAREDAILLLKRNILF